MHGMRGATTLVPARFMTLIGHLCVLISLLWESQNSTRLCAPELHKGMEYSRDRLVVGLALSIALTLTEVLTFMCGLTMFSPGICILSTLLHGIGPVFLTYWWLEGWLCDWFWIIFATCNVLPTSIDVENGHDPLMGSLPPRPWSRYLLLAGVATTVGSSLPVGYNIGCINTPADVLKQFCNESFISRYDVVLTDTWLSVLWASIVSIFIVGGCTGSVLGSLLADSLGRKKATIVTSLLSVVGAALFVLCRAANSVEMLLLGRLIVGLAGGLTTSIVPMYLTELAPPAVTGAMGVACPVGVNVGVLVGQLCGLDFILGGTNNWPYLLSVYVILVIICLPVLFILPESPKYLYIVKRDEETALDELSKLRGRPRFYLADDIKSLRAEAAASAGSRAWSMARVASSAEFRLPLLLIIAMQAGQQTSGINAVFYYSSTIFKSAGISEQDSQYATIGCGAVNVCTALIMVWLLPRVGRRPLLLGSVLGSVVSLTVLAAAMKFLHVSGMSFVCIGAVLTYVLVYGFGLGPIPYFIASEMLEVSARGAGMAWGSLANWGGNFLVGMCFPLMRDYLGPYSFLVFAAATALLFVFLKLYFPETRGKMPSEVSQLCSRGFQSRPTRPFRAVETDA